MRSVRRTWTIGGAGLIVAGVIGMLWSAAPGLRGFDWVVTIVFGASVLFLAIGLSREASVVARNPLGVGALAVVALWPLVPLIAEPLLPRMDPATFEAGLEAYRAAESASTALFYSDLAVSFGAALIAVVMIARSPTVPQPWRWAPMWALGVQIVSAVVPQYLFAIFFGSAQISDVVALAGLIAQLGFLARTLGLGVLALVLAARVRPGSVEVLRSAEV